MYDKTQLEDLKKKINHPVIEISSYEHKGLEELISTIRNTIKDIPKKGKTVVDYKLNDKNDPNEFSIEVLANNVYLISGGLVKYLEKIITISSEDSFALFQKIIKDKGVVAELKKKGMQEGDTIIIGELEFEWID